MKRGRLLITAALLTAAVAVAYGYVREVQTHPGTSGPLHVDPADLGIGPVWATASHRHIIRVTNPSDEPITVKEFVPSCSCTSVTPEAFTLGPGESLDLEVELDLTQSPPKGSAFDGTTEVDLNPAFANPLLPIQKISIRAHASVPVKPFGRTVHVGALELDAQPPSTATVRLRVHPGITAVDISAESEDVELTVERGRDSDPQTWILEVRPTAAIALGRFEIPVKIETRSSGGTGESPPTTELTLTGNTTADVQFAPGSLHFPPTAVGQTAEETVTVWTQSGAPLSIKRVTSEAPGLTGRVEQLSGSQGAVVTIEKTVQTAGAVQEEILIETSVADASRGYRIRIPVNSYGTSDDALAKTSRDDRIEPIPEPSGPALLNGVK